MALLKSRKPSISKRPSLRRSNSRNSFAHQFFPAWPKKLRLQAKKSIAPLNAIKKFGIPNATNVTYVRWLRNASMLRNANKLAQTYIGKGSMWQNPYAKPRPRSAVQQASVWYTAYPISIVTKDKQSIIASLADDELWKMFQAIGIGAMHTGPLKQAGGINGWKLTPSIDGHFDRISNHIDPLFGSEKEFQAITHVAAKHGGIIIDDIVPGHTGKGADFRLAEMKYADYPGIYHMVEIAPEDLVILPPVLAGQDSVNLNAEIEDELKKRGYIIGRLQRVIFYEAGVKETNWSATKPVKGVDGVTRRWVYLHYFKAGQPSINWLDPTFAGIKLVIGDALHSLGVLGSKGVRLDANGFLGLERSNDDSPAWSEGHPLSEAANLMIAGMVRKLGGFTFQELNLSLDDLKTMAGSGADLSYDFVNRPAYHHALIVGDTEFLRLTLRMAHEYDIDPASLVHAMQNHDDLTYELVHFWTIHKDDIYHFRNVDITGTVLLYTIRYELATATTGKQAPYNALFTTNGIACTTVSLIAASLGITDLRKLTDIDKQTIKQVHILLAMFNCLQPGVFALSGWDLLGCLPLALEQVKDLIQDGDTRWINRGGYDLLGLNPQARQSAAGMPIANSLYGSLPEQLANTQSFVSQLQQILAMRDNYSIATARQIDIPDVSDKAVLVMVHELPKHTGVQLTVLNFSGEQLETTVSSEYLPCDATVTDMLTNELCGTITALHNLQVTLKPYQGRSLLLTVA
jgi:trehalose synthase